MDGGCHDRDGGGAAFLWRLRGCELPASTDEPTFGVLADRQDGPGGATNVPAGGTTPVYAVATSPPELLAAWTELGLSGTPATVDFTAWRVVAIATTDNSEKRCWGDVTGVEHIGSQLKIVVTGAASECSAAPGPRALVLAYAPLPQSDLLTEVNFDGRAATEGIAR